MTSILTEKEVQSLMAKIDKALEGWSSLDEREVFVSHINFWVYCSTLAREVGRGLLSISGDSVQPSQSQCYLLRSPKTE